jgi:hypothetical protein
MLERKKTCARAIANPELLRQAAAPGNLQKVQGSPVMKFTRPLSLSIGLLLLCACTMFEAKKPAPAPMVPPKPLTIPVGKNWKVIEEAPQLTDERGHVPFQMEQSVQPPGAQPVSPADKRKLETPR